MNLYIAKIECDWSVDRYAKGTEKNDFGKIDRQIRQ